MGPLFAGELPALQGDAGAMKSVRTIVLGAEGSGPDRWRKQFVCNANGSDSWPISEDVRAQGSGWYFVRLYDVEDHLIDSLDFRYAAGLQKVEVATPDPKQNHLDEAPVRVTFTHNEDVSVKMVDIVPPQLEHSTLRDSPSTTSVAE